MEILTNFFHGFTWVDSILVVILGFCALEGYALGGVIATFDLIKFLASFLLGLKFYALAASPLIRFVHMSKGYANALGFFIAAFVIELLLHILLRKVVKRVNNTELFQQAGMTQLNNIIGIFPGVLSGIILLMFVLTVIMTLPVSPYLKNLVNDSEIGALLVSRSQVTEREIAGAFGGAANDTLNFLTIEPKSNESLALGFKLGQGVVDVSSENQMLVLVNKERVANGVEPLVMDPVLQKLARDYAQQMLAGGYFSHYTPGGLSPFDRMSQRDIVFSYAGENLAFSPNVALAMQGLMNSPGHRANILSKNFKRVGIGVVDAGIYGEMFVQEFTD